MVPLRRAFSTIPRHAVLIMVFIVIAFFAGAILVWVPTWQVASLRNAKGVKVQEVFKAENDARTTLAQMLGGFAVLIGVYFAWQNINATKEGQITDRFYKAIEQLGATDDKGK